LLVMLKYVNDARSHECKKCLLKSYFPSGLYVSVQVLEFWQVTPCRLVDIYQHLGGMYWHAAFRYVCPTLKRCKQQIPQELPLVCETAWCHNTDDHNLNIYHH